MLKQVADGVFVHESGFCQSNTIAVRGAAGVLLVDPGVHSAELVCLAGDLAELGQPVVAGFATHPHWDHLLWHAALGEAPRLSTALCATTATERLAGGVDRARFGIPDEVSLDLVGQVTGLPAGTTELPWDGPAIRIIEHQAHAPGHAALLIPDRGVLIAGDMLSDRLIPMLAPFGADPVGDYLTGLRLLGDVAGDVGVVIPGHGSAGAAQPRIDLDRAYVQAVRNGDEPADPRIGPAAEPGWEWVADVHAGQLQRLTS